MGSIEQEKEYLYWLCRSLPAFAVTIRQIQETYGSFQQAYYIEGMELLRRGCLLYTSSFIGAITSRGCF